MYALVERRVGHAAGHDPRTHAAAIGRPHGAASTPWPSPTPCRGSPTSATPSEIMTVDARQPHGVVPVPQVRERRHGRGHGRGGHRHRRRHGTARGGSAPTRSPTCRGWADAHDIWYLSQRPVLHRSPALAECARRALDIAGVEHGRRRGLDLYSCFPSSVEVAQHSFGIAADDARPLTLTGGLPYHGGPGSNYVTHSIANTLQWLRSGTGTTPSCTATATT